MFAQIGGCLAILAVTEGRRRAMQFVGTILIAFYAALALFYLWPAAGPSVSCPDHFSMVPSGPLIYKIQYNFVAALGRFRARLPLNAIGEDYYVALPCMHLIQPLIVIWFMRRWKRMVILLIAYDVLMLPAILLLEQHYLVDLIASVPVAALAIAIAARDALPSVATNRLAQVPEVSPNSGV